MAGPKHPRRFSEGFKRQIVQLYDSGKPAGEIKAEYDIGSPAPHRWARAIHEDGPTEAADDRTPGQQRTLEPEREDKQPRMEVDVSKTAAPMFARKQPR